MNAISFSELRSALGERKPPIVLDVRRRPAYKEATDTLAGALRRDPDAVGNWMKTLPRASSVVVYCARGHEVSGGEGAAAPHADSDEPRLEG